MKKKYALFVIVHCSDRGILREDTWLEWLVKLSDTQKVLGSVQVFICGVQIFSQYSRFLPRLIGDCKVPLVMDKTMNAL